MTSYIRPSLTYMVSALLVGSGIRAVLDPAAQSAEYSIPLSPTNSDYVRGMGGRNLAIGLSIGSLMFLGNKQGLRVTLLTGIVVGFVDIWCRISYAGREMDAAAWNHVVGDDLAEILGWWWLSGS